MISGISIAQEQVTSIDTTFPCFETKALFNTLREKYKEFPIILGKAEDNAKSTMSLWIHPAENTWTIVSTKENLSCVVGVGTNFKLVTLPAGKSI
jgi:hypothetical protein